MSDSIAIHICSFLPHLQYLEMVGPVVGLGKANLDELRAAQIAAACCCIPFNSTAHGCKPNPSATIVNSRL